jgi:hypothetical protein
LQFGQAKCKDILTVVPKKITWHFSKFATKLCKFWKFDRFFEILNWKRKMENEGIVVGRYLA